MTTVLVATRRRLGLRRGRRRAGRRGDRRLPGAGGPGRAARRAQLTPDLVVLDLQIGNAGGVATSILLRQEQDMDRLGPCRILMLLDRLADVFMAQIARATAGCIKPIDAVRLRRAATAGAGRRAVPRGHARADGLKPARRRRPGGALHGASLQRVVAQFGSALRSGRRGREFKSPPPDHRLCRSTAAYRCPQATTDHAQTTRRPHLLAGRAGGQWHGAALGSTCRRLSSDSSAAPRTVADSGLITVPLDSPPARTPPAAVSDLADVEASFVDPCDHEAQESCSPGVRCTPGDMGCPDVIVEVAEVNPQMFTTGASVSGTLAS